MAGRRSIELNPSYRAQLPTDFPAESCADDCPPDPSGRRDGGAYGGDLQQEERERQHTVIFSAFTGADIPRTRRSTLASPSRKNTQSRGVLLAVGRDGALVQKFRPNRK